MYQGLSVEAGAMRESYPYKPGFRGLFQYVTFYYSVNYYTLINYTLIKLLSTYMKREGPLTPTAH